MKDLERKVANLFMDNVALKTKLEASRKVERQQQEEIASLKQRLMQALRAQVHMYFWSMPALYESLLIMYIPTCTQQDTAIQEQLLSKTRESQLEDKIKVLEEAQSNLEAEVEKLEQQLKQPEIFPSDIEQLTMVHIHIVCSFCMCACVCTCVRA